MSSESENNNTFEQQNHEGDNYMSEEYTSDEVILDESEEKTVSEEATSEETISEEVTSEEEQEEDATSEKASEEDAHEGKNVKKRSFIKYIICAVSIVALIAIIAAVSIFVYNKLSDDEDEQYLFYEGLVCVYKDGEWGYANKRGELIIDTEYKDAYPFSKCGLALVADDDGYGFIDKNGDYVIKPKYGYAKSFHDELEIAAVCDSVGEWGVINKKGEKIIKTKYKQVDIYDCGVVVVVDANDNYGLFDVDGERLLDAKYKSIDGFVDSDTAVVKDISCSGIVDKNGKILVSIGYEDLVNFNENGYGWYFYRGKWGIIKKNGKEVTDPEYDEVSPFDEKNVAIVGIKNNDGVLEYGLVNCKGKEILEPKYASIGEFGDAGLACFQKEKDGKYGVIDRKGNIIVDAEFERIEPFYFESTVAMDGDKYYLIDKKGNVIDAPDGCSIVWYPSDCGLVTVCEMDGESSGSYGYANKKGELVIECDYDSAYSFADCGVALVKNGDGTYEYINKKGDAISEEYSYALPHLDDGYAVVCNISGSRVKFGIIDKKCDEITDIEYDDIRIGDSSALNIGAYSIINSDQVDIKGYLLNLVKMSMTEESLGMTYSQFENAISTYTNQQLKSLMSMLIGY